MYKLITFCVLILALGGCHHFGVRGDILGDHDYYGNDGHDYRRKWRHSHDDDD
jgi:hypothetical protein